MFRGGVFAMKGGTALNLFVHDMPRLSVDIDLAYPAWATPRDKALRAIAGELASIAQRLERLGLAVRSIAAAGLGESKLLIERAGAQVKVEANLVFLGTVRPVERRSLAPRAAELFSAELSVPSLALDELYGSKLVAALDRQHPRDLFDVLRMYEAHGLTDAAIECFVLYLAGHNRPMHEVLVPRRRDIAQEFESSFAGMTREPIELEALEKARDRLLADLPSRLTAKQRAFLIGLARAEPDWSLVACPHAGDLPAIRWRLQNLEEFKSKRPDQFERQVRALEDALGG
ncbi:MAG: nucleotidyl transferase AbiEii/AbiGii toxin family protein [Phycisphaeraceae bacterium]|nr:nucleotidyl transferase AbiEii/AbiGii toxin family protein [Phycisphaeraceae bacterium]